MENLIHEIKLKEITINNNVFLAPMAGVTDIPFRKICRAYGPGLTYTEMASSKAMEYNSDKTERLLSLMEDERPSAVQIFGSNPDVIANTILKLNENETIDIIDINMGCPAPKLVKNGDGAGLLLDLKNVERIIKKATQVSSKIITVKTRRGFDEEHITAIEVAKMCEEYGVSMITIHGRTREEYYTGLANLDIIKKVKDTVAIPVIGNGDIVDVASAKNMFEYTGCDGIMVARGAEGNPWIFKSILEGKDYIPSNMEKLETILRHIDYALAYDDKKQATLKMRKHISWYLKGLPESTKIKDKINRCDDINVVKEILRDYFYSI
ncbi:MAG: tRNA dihydrouridine synthase DusB [Clostridia bacterium]|nr:tRNA dihydrouridine synthase DusB [Clostridia bacterium]